MLGDEINRTPPKTQAALLEAMEEGRVTIDGTPLDFPIRSSSAPRRIRSNTKDLSVPEAQLDRFMVKIERLPAGGRGTRLLARVAGGFDARSLERRASRAVTGAAEILAAQRAVRATHVSDSVQRYVYRIVAETRRSPRLSLGASPRAGVALLLASQAAAARSTGATSSRPTT